MFTDATREEIDQAMELAWSAFLQFRDCSLKQRADLMRAIATEIGNLGDELLQVAGEETSLPEARLRNERTRTLFQLTSYAEACEKGDWLEARIDRGSPDRNPPKPDLRKMRIPLGPVVVFGAANFPFAYSTAGGDTASALAAGCPVIVKAHPHHARTSELVASAITKACASHYMPKGLFAHVHGTSFEVGKALVEHPRTKAVGFTGSRAGGRQLFDWASQRTEPIPVFAEMSSINPVFLLPGKLAQDTAAVAEMYAASITLGVGQFCTNPGLLIGISNESLDLFIDHLGTAIGRSEPGTMLNAGIFKNYVESRANALSQPEVEMLAVAGGEPQFNQGVPTIAAVNAPDFLSNPLLHQEVFGPYSLVVKCADIHEMNSVATGLEGQLTTTVMATEQDLSQSSELLSNIKQLCGRMIINGVPTGVEVTAAMHHGGPYPATTDSRFTSVGEDAIKRFSRPFCFQNWPQELLPVELKDDNSSVIARIER
jgi:NADP-dependent aldehyde dehydrogenase